MAQKKTMATGPLDAADITRIEAEAASQARAATMRGARRGIREALTELAGKPDALVGRTPTGIYKAPGTRRPSATMSLLIAQVEAQIRATPGLRARELAEKMGNGIRAADIREPLLTLRNNGSITTQGARQGTRYWVDESTPPPADGGDEPAVEQQGPAAQPAP